MTAPKLLLASQAGNAEEVKKLLELGADANEIYQGANALWIATQNGHIDTVEVLLAYPVDINYDGPLKKTPLWLAASRGYEEIAKKLIDKNADINQLSLGCSPLWVAVQEGHYNVAKLLINNKCHIDLPEQKGRQTPLFRACLDGNIALVNLLVSAGANVNSSDSKGITPLCAATSAGHVEIVKILLEAGANVHAVTTAGNTALFYAQSNKYDDIVELLLDKGADAVFGDNLLKKYTQYLELLPGFDEQNKQLNLKDCKEVVEQGFCAGYAHLCNFFTEKEGVDLFHDFLKQVSGWDGQRETLVENPQLHHFIFSTLRALVNKHLTVRKTKDYKTESFYRAGMAFKENELIDFINLFLQNKNHLYFSVFTKKTGHVFLIRKYDENEFVIYDSLSATGPLSADNIQQLVKALFIKYAEESSIFGASCYQEAPDKSSDDDFSPAIPALLDF